VVALSRVYAHAVGASDPDDPLAKAALAAADVAVAEDLAAPTPRVVRRASSPSSPYSPVRVSGGNAAPVSPPPPVPSVERATSPGVARVLSVGPDARKTPTAPAPPRLAPPPSIPAVSPGVERVPSPDPDRRRSPTAEPEPDVMPCHKAHRKELRDRKRQEERRFRKLLAKAREESEQRTPHKGTSRAIARVMRDLAAATAALDAASRISQQEEELEEAVAPPRFRGPLREDAAVEKRRVALELLRDMRCGR